MGIDPSPRDPGALRKPDRRLGSPAKKPYQSPRLLEHGDFRKLTRTLTKGASDGLVGSKLT